MIIEALLIGAALLVGGSLVAKYWNSIVDWLKRCLQKVKQVIKTAVYGTKVFIKKIGEAIEEISKHYAKENGPWQETVITRKVNERDVPEDIRAMAQKYRETDITDELEAQLTR